mmetsp:Transcript_6257/g.5621  ORF Transcript_6257/g.5621 Transcript_6257/m.5621 type:complete len:134 (+) Transcript_6257:582-983(+)
MSIGQHHNLLMDEEGKLYGFGARLNGQMDGTNHTGREEQCSIMEIPVPIPQGRKIVKFKASNLRSYAFLDDNQVWFWGGYLYQNHKRLFIDGFNLLNEEVGIPQDRKIEEFGMGFAHDTVMVEEKEAQTINID